MPETSGQYPGGYVEGLLKIWYVHAAASFAFKLEVAMIILRRNVLPRSFRTQGSMPLGGDSLVKNCCTYIT